VLLGLLPGSPTPAVVAVVPAPAVVPVVPVDPDEPDDPDDPEVAGTDTERFMVELLPLAVVPEIVLVAFPPVAMPPAADPPLPPAPPFAFDVDDDDDVNVGEAVDIPPPATAITGTVHIEATRIPRSLCFIASPLFFLLCKGEGKFPLPLPLHVAIVQCLLQAVAVVT